MNEESYALALKSIVTLRDLAYAQSRLDFWRERRDHAGSRIEAWQKELKRLEAKNEGKAFEAVPYATF